jgi:hypothetical protein
MMVVCSGGVNQVWWFALGVWASISLPASIIAGFYLRILLKPSLYVAPTIVKPSVHVATIGDVHAGTGGGPFDEQQPEDGINRPIDDTDMEMIEARLRTAIAEAYEPIPAAPAPLISSIEEASPPAAEEPRGVRRPLHFEFLLDGRPVGESVPDGLDPGAAALDRAIQTGENWTARRITLS